MSTSMPCFVEEAAGQLGELGGHARAGLQVLDATRRPSRACTATTICTGRAVAFE